MLKPTAAVNERTIIAQAPCRADLAGGTMDLWPLYLFHPGALTLNFAVRILTTCRVTPLKGKRIRLRSLDTRKEESFASFDELRATRRFRLPLAARLLQFFAPREGLLIETDSESPAGAGVRPWWDSFPLRGERGGDGFATSQRDSGPLSPWR
jgi:D-glycero-alpha-D-manno-heptose-7-phosphate kinase